MHNYLNQTLILTLTIPDPGPQNQSEVARVQQ